VKVILCENVPNLGEMGATVKVADGYARNFLLPRKLAVNADSSSAKHIEHEMRIIHRREEKVRAQLTEVAKKLAGVTVEIKAKAGAEDRIFGSVTTAQIAESLKAQGFTVDRKAISLDEPIKSLGIYTANVRLIRGVEAPVKVWVTKEQTDEEIAAAAAAAAVESPAQPEEIVEVPTEEEGAE
jgi:large subunit ribosomal protein L9